MNLELIEQIDLLLFEIGGRLFAADASQVRRIDRPDADALSLPALGALRTGIRALVFDVDGVEAQLRVDLVHGFRQVPVETLRRMPLSAGAEPYAIGLWMDGERPVLLVDLMETQRGRMQPDAARDE